MISLFKKTVIAAALAATALAGATPALADSYRGHRGGGDVAGAAVAAGIFGLAIGAIIASGSHHDHDRYADGYDRGGYDNGYQGGYYAGDYYPNGAPRGGYYHDREGYRYDRDGRPYGYDRDGFEGRHR